MHKPSQDLTMSENTPPRNSFITEGRSPTLDYAISLVAGQSASYNQWRLKELGLQFALFGLAEVQALRIQQLASLVYKLEKQVFSDDIIDDLDPKRLVDLYRMGISAINESSAYVNSTLKSMDWAQIETMLLQMQASEASGSSAANNDQVVSELAARILSTLNINGST